MNQRELVGGSFLNETWTRACSKGNPRAIETYGPMLDQRVLDAQLKFVDMPIKGPFALICQSKDIVQMPIEIHC